MNLNAKSPRLTLKSLEAHLLAGLLPTQISKMTDTDPTEISDLLASAGKSIGKSECYPHIVAIRSRGSILWPKSAATAISRAKEDHDYGRVNLTFFSGEHYLVMYAFPTNTRRKPWFYGENPL